MHITDHIMLWNITDISDFMQMVSANFLSRVVINFTVRSSR